MFSEAATQNNKQDHGFQCFLFFFKNSFFVMCEYLCVCHMCVESHEGHERALHSLPGAGVSGDVGAGANVNSGPLQEQSMLS